MEGRRRGRQVLTNDGAVANLAVAEGELVVGETDGAGIVGAFGEPQGLGQEGHAPGRFPLCGGDPPMHAPEIGKASRVRTLAGVGRPPQGLARLPEVILEKPRLRQRTPEPDLVITLEARLPQGTHQQGRGLGPMPLLQSRERPLEQLRHVTRVYVVYTSAYSTHQCMR
jgi:hypothetical protein